jgi:steroid delta-isomerase-like uncharacterized protein
MSTETNKAIVRRYHEEVWNRHRLDLLDEFIADDFGKYDENHVPGHDSREILRASITAALEALPDFQRTLHDLVAEGNKVVIRYTYSATHQGELFGIPASGNLINVSGATIFRLDDDKITQFWAFNDNLGLMQQLGAAPTPDGGGQ